jgi:hypothetical protein
MQGAYGCRSTTAVSGGRNIWNRIGIERPCQSTKHWGLQFRRDSSPGPCREKVGSNIEYYERASRSYEVDPQMKPGQCSNLANHLNGFHLPPKPRVDPKDMKRLRSFACSSRGRADATYEGESVNEHLKAPSGNNMGTTLDLRLRSALMQAQ